jgi:hypothetical protein
MPRTFPSLVCTIALTMAATILTLTISRRIAALILVLMFITEIYPQAMVSAVPAAQEATISEIIERKSAHMYAQKLIQL